MQAVFGLIENDRVRAFNHLVGNFFAAAGGKTMKNDGIGLSFGEESSLLT